MKITDIRCSRISIPLNRTFKTALRTVDHIDNLLVTVTTDSSLTGFGGAAPTAVITGETIGSIEAAVFHIRDQLLGMDLRRSEELFQRLNRCIIGNTSAKAAVDMALFDLLAKSLDIPLYQLLGGMIREIETDITISLDSTEKMLAESRERAEEGFTIFKIKVGGKVEEDIDRLQRIHETVAVRLRIDANQGWTAKEAVTVGRELARRGIDIELMEQPVGAADYHGLAWVRERLVCPVYADESLFSPQDALRLVTMAAVDGLNIKLMKCGGIYNALKIVAIAEAAGIPCMIGSMMESHVSVTAAAHLAASRAVISRFDLDAPFFCRHNPAVGGISYQGAKVVFAAGPGLGIERISTDPPAAVSLSSTTVPLP
jgi:L-Ala-D/L-Glu epimerase